MPTPSMEDYIEQIYNLIQTKGYSRVADLAEALNVHPSSVTKMVQKLDKDDYLDYEKYRGFILTEKGNKIGEKLVFRHDLLEQFLEVIGVDEDKIYDDVEGIEHHLSWNSIDRIVELVQYFKEDESRIEDLKKVQSKSRIEK
ncbi:MAG TPA: transcriptional regulator MntR [Candidatus Avamphibacillus intestinigallinarum]|nr:transcriptional regulator MntR [Candidatus Avamphibacillus intestinigallinarum]